MGDQAVDVFYLSENGGKPAPTVLERMTGKRKYPLHSEEQRLGGKSSEPFVRE